MITITVTTKIYPTEDDEKVIQALENVLEFKKEDVQEIPGKENIRLALDDSISYECEFKRVKIELIGHQPLRKLHEMFRSHYIVQAAREVLISAKKQNPDGSSETTFMLNKQAALMKKVKFSEEGECPMGPIIVKIKSDDDIQELINWLTPQTKNGYVIEPKDSKFNF
ncbi:MAG: RNA-binding domain-containing protein [Promethearchaeota archaeon]